MGVLSITPSLEFAAHGLLPGRGAVRDPNPVVQPDGGPRTSHYIWDIVTGGAPAFNDDEAERQTARGTVSRQYLEEQGRQQPIAFFADRPSSSSSSRPPVDQQRNAQIVKRKLGPMAKGMAKKRARK